MLQTPVPAVQSPQLPALTLLGIPAVVVFLWIFKHTLFSGFTLGWDALAELVLPLGACIFATLVFLLPNPMHALLSLLGVFFTTVLFYLAAGIAFVGLVFLIVYVGAVAVLFLFVIMLLNVKSLTSKDALLRHITQWLAIFVAACFFYQLRFRIFAAVGHALVNWNAQAASLELTSAEAVLFYIRFTAADINQLTGLYSIHAAAFWVTTAFLLVSLLGAIILATVTVERALALVDIRSYGKVLSASPFFLFVTPSAALDLTQLYELLFQHLYFPLSPFSFGSFSEHLLYCLTFLVANFPLLFMSMYTPGSHRNRPIACFHYERSDATYDVKQRKVRLILPKRAISGRIRVLPILRFLHKRCRPKFIKPAPWYRGVFAGRLTKRPIRAAIRRRFGNYLTRRRACELLRKYSVHEEKRKMFVARGWPAAIRSSWRRLTNYLHINAAVHAVTKKWNNRDSLPFYQVTIRRAVWLWRWRPERATSLLRALRYFDATTATEIAFHKRIKEPFWLWSPYLLRAPANPHNLGLFGYLRYFYSTRAFPHLYYWMWRARGFLSIWIFMVVFLPFLAVPFPWFFDDYDVAWSNLRALHRDVYDFIEKDSALFSTASPWLLKEVVTLFLLYPVAAFRLVFFDTWTLLGVSLLYAYEVVLSSAGDFPRAEVHDSACNYFRIVADNSPAKLRAERERVARSRRHPDKGRIDASMFITLLSAPFQAPTLPPETNSSACPVSTDKWWDTLASIAEAIRPTPGPWLRGHLSTMQVYYWSSFNPLPPFLRLAFFVIVAAFLYSLCSFFIILNWARVYGNRSRPSLLFHVVLVLAIFYAWICLYPYFSLESIFGVYLLSTFGYVAHCYWALQTAIVPYLIVRAMFFKNYKQFAYGNTHWLRIFANYYYTLAAPASAEEVSMLTTETAATSIDELKEQVVLGRAADQSARIKDSYAWRPMDVYVHRTLDTSYHDPEPNAECRPRRSGSHRYMTSPFTGRPPAFVKRKQARRPMPSRVTFTGMFYPVLLVFVNLFVAESTMIEVFALFITAQRSSGLFLRGAYFF